MNAEQTVDAILHKYSGEEGGVRVVRCIYSDLRRDFVRLVSDLNRELENERETLAAWKRLAAMTQPKTLFERLFG